MGRVLQRIAKVIQLRARLPFVRTIEREGGSVFPLVRQRLLPLRVCPVSRDLSGGSEDGESPSEDGPSQIWRTIEREGGSVFPLVRQRLLPLRVCPVSRDLSGGSEDGESPSEDGQSHS